MKNEFPMSVMVLQLFLTRSIQHVAPPVLISPPLFPYDWLHGRHVDRYVPIGPSSLQSHSLIWKIKKNKNLHHTDPTTSQLTCSFFYVQITYLLLEGYKWGGIYTCNCDVLFKSSVPIGPKWKLKVRDNKEKKCEI